MLTADGSRARTSIRRQRPEIRPRSYSAMRSQWRGVWRASGLYNVSVNAHNINVLRTGSKFEALSADAHTLDGLNIHCAIVDELHAHKTRDVWEVLETATGARSQPLIWSITTAGSNRSGICYEQRTYVTKILDRVAEDESYFGNHLHDRR
jgi:phage terminase large subunit-like protein